jgi:NhaP-type Na+/H+ or K+/H+ antiporter
MEWAVAVAALALIGVAAVSRRIDGTSLTPAILFVAIGLLVGKQALDLVTPSPTSATVKHLAEATLAFVLFTDASRIDLRALRREYAVPARLLGLGLPLTIALGAALAAALFGALSFPEALVLAVVLAPTDAALGQAVVTEPRLPSRIRQGLNVESGLNDGICVPLLLIVLATASGSHAHGHVVLEEIGWGIAGGLAAGLLGSQLTNLARSRNLIADGWRWSRSPAPRWPTASPSGSAARVSSPRSWRGWCSAICYAATPARSPSSPSNRARCWTASRSWCSERCSWARRSNM